MIHKKSRRQDWEKASSAERMDYATRKCAACAQKGLGTAIPALVVEGITEFFTAPLCRNKSVDVVYGIVFGAITQLGHYRRLLDKYRMGP